ncbi:MAG: hypothetical protein R3Y08_00165 [Rikenellaceae bacterium]
MISRLLRVLLTIAVVGVATFVVLNRGGYTSMLPAELFEWKADEVDSVQLDALKSDTLKCDTLKSDTIERVTTTKETR